MNLMNKIRKVNIFFLLKTGVGSAIAILIANRFGLAYSASAGIITLLTIQNTKKETIFVALRRILAFLVAVVIAYIIFSSFGYTSIAFGGFVFVFIAACNALGLEDGISMNAVLTTHFLIEKKMDMLFLINETSLLLIGMSIGIMLNLIMPRNKEKILQHQRQLEGKIKNKLCSIGKVLEGKQQNDIDQAEDEPFDDFSQLDGFLEDLLRRAYEDAGNRFLTDTKYLISYLEMRKVQIVVLKDIVDNIKKIHVILPQAYVISEYIQKVADSFHELNDVKNLLLELERLNEFFKNEKLPTSREEFENRAILFHILKDLEYFLELKRSFVEEIEANDEG